MPKGLSNLTANGASPLFEVAFRLSDHLSPIDCRVLKVTALVCAVLFGVSLAANSFVIAAIALDKKMHTSFNILITTITIFQLAGSILEFPLIIASYFNCGFQ